ncbi:MAG: hypothetical protein ABIN67_23015 [Ferruginibacter sp.]
MKKIFLMLLSTYTIGSVTAQNDRDQPFSTKSFANQPIKDVEVETSGGNISVESTSADKSRIEVFVWPSNGRNKTSLSKEEIQKKLDEFYDLKIDVANNKLTAIAKSKSRKWDRNNSLSISFKIYVTTNVSTNLTTSGGNINLRDLVGQQRITTSGGNLNIDHVKGKLRGTTSGGNINVKESEESIELTTSGGNIDADNCKGDVKLVTSGGSIRLENMAGNTEAVTSGGNVHANIVSGDLQAHTSGGNIDLAGLSCNVETATSGGNIRVEIKEPGQFIKIRNSGGNITLQLPANKGYDLDLSGGKIKTDNLNNFSGKTSEDELNGKLNGGGAKVSVDAGDGRITLTLK